MDRLKILSEEYCQNTEVSEPVFLDAGCGEGYYTHGISSHLANAGLSPQSFGVDISKHAAQYAAKRKGTVKYAVASAFDLPFGDNSVDLLLNVFAPFAKEEYLRVLKPGGMVLYVYPDQQHLMGLKNILYDIPRSNPPYDVEKIAQGFSHWEQTCLSFPISVEHEDLMGLFQMTPYFWKSPTDAVERLEKEDKVQTEAAFCILQLFSEK